MSADALDLGQRRQREASTWAELEALLTRLEKQGEGALSIEELERLGALYRNSAAQLSRARASGVDARRTQYLDALVRRAHFVVYAPPKRGLRPLLALFSGGFAATFRATGRLQVLAAALFVGGALAGYVGTLQRVENAYPILGAMFPAELVQGLIESPEVRAQYISAGQETGFGGRSAFAAALAANNARVAYVAFALGIVFGIPTVLLQIFNGAVLGSMAALYDRTGVNLEFWAWILPHGIPEILALVVAAAGGLLLARALIAPGARPRREVLVAAGAEAAKLVGLATVLLFYAALIEGHFRQFSVGIGPRFALAAVNFVALTAYLTFAGQGARTTFAGQDARTRLGSR